jgi:tetratricopeptide (TPR) repeat protein
VLSFGFHDPVLIADFDNQTGDSRFDHALQTALIVSLEQTRYATIFSRLQTGNALRLMHAREDEKITAAVGREICERENIPGLVVPAITRTGQEYLLTAQLIDPANGATVRAYSEKAHGEGQILSALDAISLDIRRDLGESQYRIHRSHRPLPQVTTSSLAALEKYADGTALWDLGKASEAVALYRAALADDPDFAMAHAALGSAYYSFYFNEPGLGEQEFRKALDLSSRVTERERALIELRFASAQGRVQESLALYRAYIRQYPDDWAVRYSYAHMLRQHGHARDSIGLYPDLLRQSPDNSGAYLELATAYFQTGQWAQSIRAYEKAFALDPARLATGDISREYGFTLVRNGEDAKAEQLFSAQLADPASYATGERSLAFLDFYHGRYRSARQRLLLALARSDDPFSVARIRYMLAVVAAGEGDRQEQLIQLDRIMANFDALNLKVLYGSLIGQAYARAGEVEKARKALTMIAPVVNDRVEEQAAYAQVLKAEVAAASGDFRAALEFMKPPEADDSNASAVLTRESLAHIYQEMGERDEAMTWYRGFAESIGSDALGWEPQQEIFEAYYRLASDYQQKGDRGSALNVLNRMLDRWRDADPDLPLLGDAIRLRAQLVAAH